METIVKSISAAVCIALISFSGCCANTNYQTRMALQNGADPVAVACAFGRDGAGYSCTILAARK